MFQEMMPMSSGISSSKVMADVTGTPTTGITDCEIGKDYILSFTIQSRNVTDFTSYVTGLTVTEKLSESNIASSSAVYAVRGTATATTVKTASAVSNTSLVRIYLS